MRMTDTKDPTWDDVCSLARAFVALTESCDLRHDLLTKLAAPLVREMSVMVDRLVLDPHGDSDESETGQTEGSMVKVVTQAQADAMMAEPERPDWPAPAKPDAPSSTGKPSKEFF